MFGVPAYGMIEVMFADYAIACAVLLVTLIIGTLLVRLPIIRKSYLPASVAAGIVLLLLSPQVAAYFNFTQYIPMQYYAVLSPLPALLINVIFASLFLARPLLSLKRMWQLASPHVAFGQMLAWGYYMIGGILTLLVLIPVFGATPLAASLLEISFQGGHGTAAGMIPVFNELNFQEGQELAVALATTSLIASLLSGFMLIGWGRRKGHITHSGPIEVVRHKIYHRRIIHELRERGVRLREEFSPWRLLVHVFLLVLSVTLGWLLYQGLLLLERVTWGSEGLQILGYMPLFTFCMFGGMLAQAIWTKLGLTVSRPMIELLSGFALAILVTTAIGTMSLDFIGSDGLTYLLLAGSGVVWVIFCFIVLARHMFKRHWFTNGIISAGQSMGTTATGLLFAHVVDPKSTTGAVESFGYKQLLFAPLMGGGIVTAISMPLILFIGLPLFTILCAGVCVAWLLVGVLYFGRR